MQELGPFGVLNDGHLRRLSPGGIFGAMPDWRDSSAAYRTLMENWLERVTTTIWPAWQDGRWQGGAASDKEATTKAELELAVQLYHGTKGRPRKLDENLTSRPLPDGRTVSQKWHYEIEDAKVNDRDAAIIALHKKEPPSFDYISSQTIGSNFAAYSETPGIATFECLFWGRMQSISPAIFNIKRHLQRPRPWTAAETLEIDGFRWAVANGFTHTGVHPSLLSGHCIQGVLGGCSVLEALLDGGAEIEAHVLESIQQYMVDWGDRRVFAGVHYMTDNIASWTLARQIIPYLFRHPDQIEAIAVDAIVGKSQVFSDIVEHMSPETQPRAWLLQVFPEAQERH